MASVAALAALNLQQTPAGVAQWVWPELLLDPQQTSGEAAPLVKVALVVGNHRQALCWAAFATLVAPATAPLAALGLQQAPAGVALACHQWHLGHQLVPVAIFPHPVVAQVSSVAACAALDHQQAHQPYAGAALVVIVVAAPVVVVHQQAPPGAAHTTVVAAVALPPP